MDILRTSDRSPGSSIDREAVLAACAEITDEVTSAPEYRHAATLSVRVAGEDLYRRQFHGPEPADIFSVTKTVLATLVGVAQRDRALPPLDQPLGRVLQQLNGTPADLHTWHHLLTMTRGCETGGAWDIDIDTVTALPGGQVAHIAAAPQLEPPGLRFRYDNGAAHLLSAALGAVVGGPVADYAREVLFTPLGITSSEWLADPDGVSFGYGHLKLSTPSSSPPATRSSASVRPRPISSRPTGLRRFDSSADSLFPLSPRSARPPCYSRERRHRTGR